MAVRTPLVIVNGQIQQLQAGDQVQVSTAMTDTRVLTNGESATALTIGQPVYVSAAGTVKRGQANAAATSKVVGLMYDVSTAAAASGAVAVNGILVATTVQWDAVTGQTGGLTSGATYYLDAANPGKMTATSPTTVGQTVVALGIALSTTDFEVAVSSTPVLL